MSNEMKPEVRYVQISRVQNGWMLSDYSDQIRNGHYVPLLVARSPRELAGIVQAWAEKQEAAAEK